MGKELFGLVVAVVVMMIVMRLLFSELDGKNAARRMNLAYFLNFEKKFTYTKMKSTVITMVICFLLFSGISVFSSQGILILGVFVCIGMIADIFSSFVYHYYGRLRFKQKIQEAKDYMESLQKRMQNPIDEDDVYVSEPTYDFTQVVSEYICDLDHLACFSNDGGAWFSKMPKYSQVSFLVDEKEKEAKTYFADTPIRVTHLTSDKRYPFKDKKIDTLVYYNENFNPQEANRVLKPGGTVIMHQRGSENLIELYAFSDPRLFKNQWNLALCRDGLRNYHYQILGADEYRGEIRFRSVSAFYHYVKKHSLAKIGEVEDSINQYFFIDQMIQKNGYFAMRTHHFYVVARKQDE